MSKLSFGKKKNKNEGKIPNNVLNNEFTPSSPGVNIIPPQVLTNYSNASLLKKFALTGVAIITLGALGFLGGGFSINNADKQLDELRASNQVLSDESIKLAPGEQYVNTLEAKRETLASKVSLDIENSLIMSELANISSASNSSINNLTITPLIKVGEGEDGGNSAQCPSPDPFGTIEGIACISFTVDAGTGSNADKFSNGITNSDLFTSVFVQSLNTTSDTAVMQGSVLVNTNALNTRFDVLKNQTVVEAIGATPVNDDDTTTDAPEEETNE